MTTPTGSAPALPQGSCNAHCHVFGPAARFYCAPGASFVTAPPTRQELATQRAQHRMQKRALRIQAGRIKAE